MYGKQMEALAREILTYFDVPHARVRIVDSGSLDFVLAARLEAAIKKVVPAEQKEYLPPMLPDNRYFSRRDAFRISRLYLPGNTPALMLNAGIHKPNGIILDLEDSVAPDKKEEARLLVRNALRQVNFYGAERMVRINPLPGGLEDLKAVIPHHVHMVLVPKAEDPDDLRLIDRTIREITHNAGGDREVYLMPIIETALGVERAYALATATPSVAAMAVGLEDLTADLGVARTAEGTETFYARIRLVNACKAAGIQPIDSVFSDVSDMEGLEENARRSRALGFEGMGCIHPRQIRVIHKAFSPTPEEIEKASRITEAFREAQEKGLGVVSLGTKMIDPPVVKRAERIMMLAREMGLLNQPGH
jgi:citrate lyase subunit beta/citryl-CoA lyase